VNSARSIYATPRRRLQNRPIDNRGKIHRRLPSLSSVERTGLGAWGNETFGFTV
jgi:hypothetical protein